MSANVMRPQPAMKLHVLFAISFSWAFHEVPPPKYQHYDPLTSELLLCDQCPPGTAVLTHCTAETPTACSPCPERSFSEHWHWGDSCQYCTTVCKERQLVSQECNRTHDQLCECIPGYHLVVEFCIKHTSCPPGFGVTALGTPEIDTACEACPQGLFSSRMSASEPCVPHRNCSELGLKTLRPGTPTQNTLCENKAEGSVLECSQHHTQCHTDVSLCEEAIFQSLASLRLSSVPLERLLESLPGKKVDRKSLEKLKKACSPQQQILLLLRLWREQNKDQVKLYGIIQGVNHCERKVSRCAGLKNLTLGDLMMVMKSLPGVRAHEEDIRAVVSSCRSQQYLLQLLHLWKKQNKDLDINKGLSHSLSRLRQQGAPRPLLRSIKKINRIISTSSIHKMYEKMFLNMIEDGTCFNTKPYNQ
ncbi:tumor necrosis factor receptor superfamily member 11B-like isoform X2 [Oncorhynchus keta]|uniref:tumor necrosis factor receptor superfamily member 11B-like isoform X2 n=1 Tax=Oncorhynchus keta TaxID=8018 RepID=UPI00227B588B|nr:tumor necrosis factor receptor superfamily member 11B-like isoform X2 [Oncorhynchus keta]